MMLQYTDENSAKFFRIVVFFVNIVTPIITILAIESVLKAVVIYSVCFMISLVFIRVKQLWSKKIFGLLFLIYLVGLATILWLNYLGDDVPLSNIGDKNTDGAVITFNQHIEIVGSPQQVKEPQTAPNLNKELREDNIIIEQPIPTSHASMPKKRNSESSPSQPSLNEEKMVVYLKACGTDLTLCRRSCIDTKKQESLWQL